MPRYGTRLRSPDRDDHSYSDAQHRVVIRGSDDFYPREDTSHGPHLYSNAFNALLLSNLGVQDWDMFQTSLGGVQVHNAPWLSSLRFYSFTHGLLGKKCENARKMMRKCLNQVWLIACWLQVVSRTMLFGCISVH